MNLSRTGVVVTIGVTQTLAWASSYYLPAVLADRVAGEIGVSRDWFFAAFSGGLLLAAFLGPGVGRVIDRRGGRDVLAWSNLVFAVGLGLLAECSEAWGLGAAWGVMGVGMAMGLYEPAFATLAGIYGREARGAITGITLIAGFASSVGWPATVFLADRLGWRGACLVWAGLHLGVGWPGNRWLVPRAAPPVRSVEGGAEGVGTGRTVALLAFTFAAVAFVSGAFAAHLPRLLGALGVGPAGAVAAGALLGPAQVGARLVEFGVLRRVSPLVSARLAAALHPLGAVVLAVFGAPAAAVFVVLHGAGNGLLTIARGTLPLALFGPLGYGARTGVLARPARVAQAAAPLVFGAVLDRAGPWAALGVSGGLCLAGLAALGAIRNRGNDPGSC